jgi:tRNA C32,U32 (ribose-2'-O)-methylase TrmJ
VKRTEFASQAKTYFGGRIDRRSIQTQKVLGSDALLKDVHVVLCEPKIASNIGAIARSMCSFECESLSIVKPRVEVISRASLNASKGAQHIVRNARVFETLEECLDALEREEVGENEEEKGEGEGGKGSVLQSVAFSRWMAKDENENENEEKNNNSDHHRRQKHFFGTKQLLQNHPRSVALVFGSESDGLSDAQVARVDSVCEYKMGRLIESLSVTHAAVIALNAYFESRVLKEE